MGILWTVVSWIFKEILLKFVVMGAIFLAVSELTPLVVQYMGNFINPQFLTSAFAGVPPGVWFFLDFFALDLGLPLLISAYIARFVIRRLPVIG